MISKIALFTVWKLPLVVYGGLLIFALFVTVVILSPLFLGGRHGINRRWHMRLALVALALGAFHGLLGLSIFLNW